MPRRLRTALILTAVLAMATAGLANGLSLRLKLPVVTKVTDRLLPSSLGPDLYDLQEGLHAAVTVLTGVAVPHDYIWIHLGEHSVPIDPINFSK